ncbi:MAG TPA: hypothetical protein VIU40_06825, partial [Geobacteraceae bacterium]
KSRREAVEAERPPARCARNGALHHRTRADQQPLRKQLWAAGFSDLQVEPFDFLHPELPAAILNVAAPLLEMCERVPLLLELAGSLVIRGRK